MGYIGAGITRFNTADELTVTGDAQIDTTTLVVDSTNNRVGIGTASPAANRALHVSSTAQKHARFERTGAATSHIEFQDSTTTNQPSLGGVGDNLTFHTAFTERMRINNSGNVGIGTSSPATALDLAGEINFSGLTSSFPSPSQPRLYRSGSSAGSYPFNNFGHLVIQARGDGSNRDIVFATGTAGANKTVITSAGNVGIGTVSPTHNLDVFNSASSGAPLLAQFKSAGGDTQLYVDNSTITTQLTADASNTAGIVGTKTNHPFVFRTNNAERVRIDTSGNLLVGTTSLNIANNGSNTGFVVNSNGALEVGSSSTVLTLNRQSTNGDVARFQRGGTTVGSISVTGSATTYNTTSDIRLKTGIEPIDHATDMLMAINPVLHRWKADPDADAVVGFIAQEMEEIVPEAVSKGDSEDDMWSMDYGRITPVLVAALQDAHKKIEELAAEVAKLKAN
jgi:hypothetical protein